MKRTIKTLALIISAALICAALCGCAQNRAEPVPSSPPPVEPPEPTVYRYVARISPLTQGEQQLAARTSDDDSFYCVDYGHWDEALGDYSTVLFRVGFDGSIEPLEGYAPVQPPEEYCALPEFYSSHELEGLAPDADGNIVTVESLYMSWYAGPGERRDEYAAMYDAYERASYIRRLDKDGRQLSCVRLPLGADENIYAYELKIDPLGHLAVTEENYLRFFSMQAEELGRIALDGYVRCLLQSSSGEIAAVCYQQDGTELLCRIDPEDMSVKSRHTIPGGMMYLCLGEENELFYCKGQNFYSHELSTGESRELFNWLSLGVDVGTLSHIRILPDGTVRALSNGYSGNGEHTSELVEVSLRPISAAEEKAELILGCYEADGELAAAIKEFNRSSEKSLIRLKEYYLERDFTQPGQDKLLLTELLSGNIPDILVLDGMNHRLLFAKGLLADLTPFIDGGYGLSREDFFENVLNSCQRGGQLYALADSFSVDTVMADAELAGEEPGWDYQQYFQALASMPEGCQPFERYTCSHDILQSGLAMELDAYIDYSSLTADFVNDSFIALLDYAAGFPRDFDWDSYQWTDADITEYRINSGRQMLMRTSLLSMEEVYFNSIYFNGNGSYKGYPTHDGSVGSTLTLHRLCAIGESSPHKDEAWRFISSLVESERVSGSWGFPAVKVLFREKLESFTAPEYLMGEDHQPVLTEEGEKIELAQGHMGTVLGVRGFYALNETWCRRFESALSDSTRLKCENARLTELIQESVRPFFDGQMDAATAAAQVEMDVEAYLSQYK